MAEIMVSAKGRELLSEHVKALRNNGNYQPYPRALLEGMLVKTRCCYLENGEVRDHLSEAGLLSGEAVAVYIFDSEGLHKKLSHATLDFGRTTVPVGELNFEESFKEAWKQLQLVVAEHQVPSPA